MAACHGLGRLLIPCVSRKEAGGLNINPLPPKALSFALCDIRDGTSLGEMDGVGRKGPKPPGLVDFLPRGSGKPTSMFSFGTNIFCDPKRVAPL